MPSMFASVSERVVDAALISAVIPSPSRGVVPLIGQGGLGRAMHKDRAWTRIQVLAEINGEAKQKRGLSELDEDLSE